MTRFMFSFLMACDFDTWFSFSPFTIFFMEMGGYSCVHCEPWKVHKKGFFSFFELEKLMK
jgi:hypothetical protein